MYEKRAREISNHISEEFRDLGKTNFATKVELCEVIEWMALEICRLRERERAKNAQKFIEDVVRMIENHTP